MKLIKIIYSLLIAAAIHSSAYSQDLQSRVYDKKGRLIQRNRVNFFGRLEQDRLGIAVMKYEYDKKGNLTKKTYFDKNNQLYVPDTNSNNIEYPSYTIYRYDDNYNLIEVSNHYANGALMDLTYKPAVKVYKYNHFNQKVEEYNYDKAGRLTETGTMDVAMVRYGYVGRKLVEERSYDKDKKILDFGMNIVRHMYDSLNRKVKSGYYFANSDLYQTDLFFYNKDGQRIREESYKKNGKLDYTIHYTYKNGRLIKREIVYPTGEPKVETHGLELSMAGWKIASAPDLDNIRDVNGMCNFKITIDKSGNILDVSTTDYCKPSLYYAIVPLLKKVKLEKDPDAQVTNYRGEIKVGILNIDQYVEEF